MNRKLPRAVQQHPPPLLALVGGLTATLLLTSCMHLAPLLGLPFLDMPRLIGGVFTSAPAAALGIGFALFLLGGAVVAPLLLALFWPQLPGRESGLTGSLLKGVILGLALWFLSGLFLPVLGAVNRLAGLEGPGLFAWGTGWGGVASHLLGHLVYGAVLGAVTAMGQGMGVLETAGWPGYSTAGAGARRDFGQS